MASQSHQDATWFGYFILVSSGWRPHPARSLDEMGNGDFMNSSPSLIPLPEHDPGPLGAILRCRLWFVSNKGPTRPDNFGLVGVRVTCRELPAWRSHRALGRLLRAPRLGVARADVVR